MNLASPVTNISSGRNCPRQLLEQLARIAASGCLQASNSSVEWLIYLSEGKITYGTHSLDPLEKFERHLHCLSYANPNLTGDVRLQVRLLLEKERGGIKPGAPHPESQVVRWLWEQEYINHSEIGLLLSNLTREALESLFLANEIYYDFLCLVSSDHLNRPLDIDELIDYCEKRLQEWQSLSPQITSPYERPYVAVKSQLESKISPEKQEKLSRILRGFSFRQLATLLNQDELTLAKNLHSFIADGSIIVRPPQSPFDRLPKIPHNFAREQRQEIEGEYLFKIKDSRNRDSFDFSRSRPQTTVVCVDDSPSVLRVVGQILGVHNFDIFAISDPVKALREIIRLKPNLILLDVGMPNLDGYKLCRLIRNHSHFKKTPIVMVTGNSGFIDRAKAKVAGATDYLTKPFSQEELENMALKYLP